MLRNAADVASAFCFPSLCCFVTASRYRENFNRVNIETFNGLDEKSTTGERNEVIENIVKFMCMSLSAYASPSKVVELELPVSMTLSII